MLRKNKGVEKGLLVSHIINPVNPNKSTGLFGGQASGILNWNDLKYPFMYELRTEVRSHTKGSHSFSFDRATELEEKDASAVIASIQLASLIVRKINAVEAYATDPSVVSIFSTISDQLEEQVKSLLKLHNWQATKVELEEQKEYDFTGNEVIIEALEEIKEMTTTLHTHYVSLNQDLLKYIQYVDVLMNDLINESAAQLKFYTTLVELLKEEVEEK